MFFPVFFTPFLSDMKHLLLALFMLTAAFSSAQEQPKVCYEVFVRSFCDSNGDGIGDINGVTSKLDYLQSLGIDLLWLTPVSPSPSYHKYDVVEYYGIDPECGTMDDYKRLIREAHARGIWVIKDLVINHTSEFHPWFLEAKKGKDNPYRNHYVWLPPATIDSMGVAVREKTEDSWEINPWHLAKPTDDEKYYGLFWGGMPDLNYDNPVVREEMFRVAKFWLKEVGVDGFRLDAAKHLYPDWEAEKCHAFWVDFRREVESVNPDAFIVGEVYTSAEKVAPFFRGLKGNFNFDFYRAVQQILLEGKDFGLTQKLISDYAAYAKENPDFIDATLLSNHDQNRYGSNFSGNQAMMNTGANLLLTLPGLPFLYYGEEIGMLGTKPDPNIREPFLWDVAANDKGRTRWIEAEFTTEKTVAPLALQEKDPNSMFSHYKQLIALRKKHPALWQYKRPSLVPVATQPEVIAFLRPHTAGDLLVMQNLTSKPQVVALDAANAGFKKTVFAWGSVKNKKSTWTLPAYGMVILKK